MKSSAASAAHVDEFGAKREAIGSGPSMNGLCAGRARIGEVGYKFKKFFPGFGNFEGEVVQIRPGAAGSVACALDSRTQMDFNANRFRYESSNVAELGRDRRCRYQDGDMEDLSLGELRELAQAPCPAAQDGSDQCAGKLAEFDKKRKQLNCHTDAQNHSAGAMEERKRQKKSESPPGGKGTSYPDTPRNFSRDRKRPLSGKYTFSSSDHFSEMKDLVPIDVAAEGTVVHKALAHQEKSRKSASERGSEVSIIEGERETDLWLTRVATMLGAGQPSRSQKTDGVGGAKAPRSGQSQAGETVTKCSSMPGQEMVCITQPPSILDPRSSSPSSSVSIDCLTSLSDVERGARHGTKVFRLSDPRRIVGEVILEHGNGWAEAAIHGSLVKDRLGNFVVAPEECIIGDQVSPFIPLPPRIAKLMKKKLSPAQGSESYHATVSANVSSSKEQLCKQTSPQLEGIDLPFNRSQLSGSAILFASRPVEPFTEKECALEADAKLSLDSLFYWCCERCTLKNNYLKIRCGACQKRMSPLTKRSALLDIACAAVAAAQSEDEAINLIPDEHRDIIPKIVTSQLFAASRGNVIPFPARFDVPTDINLYFYWICRFCTRKNPYKRQKCESCVVTKRAESIPSALLQIALDATQDARTTKESIDSVPYEHKPAIPYAVLDSLVTCVALAGKKPNQRRCLKPKLPGLEYCATHCDPIALGDDADSTKGKASLSAWERNDHMDCDVKKVVSKRQQSDPTGAPPAIVGSLMHPYLSTSLCHDNRGAISIVDNFSAFFANAGGKSLANRNNWCILSIEDGILCQETRPFPLGLSVRRFFPRYGFHDGRIVQVLRQHIRENGSFRPVLVYRVLYNDGDNEDLMHHEINSLRQFYDRCNVEPRAQPFSQLIPGTMFETQKQGFIKIIRHSTPAHIPNKEEGGIAHVQFCKIGQPWDALNIDLTQLQMNVVRKLEQCESIVAGRADSISVVDEEEVPEFDMSLVMSATQTEPTGLVLSQTTLVRSNEATPLTSPLLEWPGYQQGTPAFTDKDDTRKCDIPGVDSEADSMISPYLWLRKDVHPEPSESREFSSLPETHEMGNEYCVLDGDDCVRHDVSSAQNGWDPANALDFTSWDPFKTVFCELCKKDNNDHQILICDTCHLGFHMYCVRPVIVNVPASEWLCSDCSGANIAGQTFSALLDDLRRNPKEVSQYLNMPFDFPADFCIEHKDALELFSPKTHPSKRLAVLGVARSKPTVMVGSLFFSCNVHKNDWIIPLSLSATDKYSKSLLSMTAAMKYCGMESYSEDLIYQECNGVYESMNDASLDSVEPLSQRNLDIFKEYKANVKQGAFPPVQIVHDEKVGFSVEALAVIPRHTLISEYVGEVTTVWRSGETSSDSLMILLDTGDPKTSLLIDPTRAGNMARFLSGINNRSHVSRRKTNVRTRRFVLDGKCRVALFTSKRIEPGDKLHYDYNAGVEGKTVLEWAKTGFYDTSNFF